MEQTQETPADDHILVSPQWLFIARISQFVISLIIVGLAAALIHDASLDEEALALAIGVITWIVVLYAVVSERWLKQFYHIIAIIVIDAVMLVLWLATFAAVAAKRAKFTHRVVVGGCVDTGSLFNSKVCFRSMSILVRRDDNVILFKRGQDELAAIAGLGALVWLLFIASFAWTLWAFLQARKQGRFQSSSTQPNAQAFQMEPKVEQQIQQQQQQIQQLQIQQQQQQIQQLQQQASQAQQQQQQQQQMMATQQPIVAYPPQAQAPYPVSYPPQEQQAFATGQYTPQQQPSPAPYQAPYPVPYQVTPPPPLTASPPPPGLAPAGPPQPYQG